MVTRKRRRDMTVFAICVAAVMGTGAWWVPAAADQAAAGDERPINIDVRDMEIGDVLRMLGQAAGVNIIVGKGVSGELQSLTLRNVFVEDALRLITESQGFYWRKDGNVYVVSAEPPAVVPAAGPAPTPVQPQPAEGPEGQPRPEASVPPPPLENELPAGVVVPRPRAGGPQIVTAMIPLKYASAVDVALWFGGTVAGPNRFSRTEAPSPYSMPAYRGQTTTGMGFMGRSVGLSRTGVTVPGLGQEPGAGFGGGFLGGGFAQPNVGAGVGTTTGTGTTTTAGTGAGASLLPGEMEPPVAIMRDNALLVQGTPEEIDEFREILALLDTPAKQVEIETKWMNVQMTKAKALGIDWAVTNGALEVWNLGFAPGEAANNGLRWGRGRFWAELAVLENTGHATVVNQPRIVCMNGTPGLISFSTEIPYFTATISYNQFGQRTVDYTSDFVSVANDLFVVPQINPDDSVQLQISPQLQDQVGTVEGPNGERIPIITTQFVDTFVRVHDGETVVLGGVVRRDEAVNNRRTPLLAEIPIIGKLFQQRRVETTESELLIFLTPRIVRDMATE